MQPLPCPAKVVAPNTASSSSVVEEYTLLDRLTEAEPQSTSMGNAMVINKPAKPIAGLSKHRQQINILIRPPITSNGKWDLLLAGEGVRYHISYCNIYVIHIYIFLVIFKYIIISILHSYIHLV